MCNENVRIHEMVIGDTDPTDVIQQTAYENLHNPHR